MVLYEYSWLRCFLLLDAVLITKMKDTFIVRMNLMKSQRVPVRMAHVERSRALRK